MRIALIKTGALGDVVRTTAVLPGLRRRHPEMDLTWITASSALELVHSHPDVSQVVAIDEPEQAAWRHVPYDWVISLDEGIDECRLASALSAQRLSGAFQMPDGSRNWTRDLDDWFGMGLLRPTHLGGLAVANELKKRNTETYAAILYKGLGLPPPVARPFFPVGALSRDLVSGWLSARGLDAPPPLIGLNSAAGGRWQHKAWGARQTAELARRLHDELSATVLVLGGRKETVRNRRIAAVANRSRVIAAPTDFNLLTFGAVIERCDLLITSDSLALHLRAAVGGPVVAFFGPTAPAEVALPESGEKVVTTLPCRYCYLARCPILAHCMMSISVADMFDAARACLPEKLGVYPTEAARDALRSLCQ